MFETTPNTKEYWEKTQKKFWSSVDYLLPWEKKEDDKGNAIPYFSSDRLFGLIKDTLSTALNLALTVVWGVFENLVNVTHYVINTPNRLAEARKIKEEQKAKPIIDAIQANWKERAENGEFLQQEDQNAQTPSNGSTKPPSPSLSEEQGSAPPEEEIQEAVPVTPSVSQRSPQLIPQQTKPSSKSGASSVKVEHGNTPNPVVSNPSGKNVVNKNISKSPV